MRRIVTYCLVLVLAQLTMAQTSGSISGHIMDMETDGEPLLFAHVTLQNTDIVEQTNFHGNFEIAGLTPGAYTMVINYLGYEPQEFLVEVQSGKTTFVEKTLKALTPNSPGLTVLNEVSSATTGTIETDAKSLRE